jgi:hypothetical protein
LIALIIDAHRSAAAVSSPCGKKHDTSIERPFASNASENVAVKQTSTAGMLGDSRRFYLRSSHDRMHFLFTMSKILADASQRLQAVLPDKLSCELHGPCGLDGLRR